MKTIYYIDRIRFSHKGIECRDFTGYWIPIHLRHGDLDGACAIYSLTMTLLMLGYLSAYEFADDENLNLRINRGRFITRFFAEKGLIGPGYSSLCLRDDIEHFCPDLEVIGKNPEDCDNAIEIIYEYLQQNIPVIISMQYSGGGEERFLVAVGAEVSDKKIEKIFCLDSGSYAPQVSPWNCYITSRSKTEDCPYWYVGNITKSKVRVNDLIVIKMK